MISVNMTKAKAIAHVERKANRDLKMKPLDIEVTIPAKATEAEAARQVIRDENALVQANIDSAVDDVELKAMLDPIKSENKALSPNA